MSDHDLIPEGMHHIKAEVPVELGGGFLRDPDVVALEKRIESTLEQTDPGENHKELMEMLGAIFVQLSRIYDVLITDSPAANALDAKHSQGELFASPPVLKEEAWNVAEAEEN